MSMSFLGKLEYFGVGLLIAALMALPAYLNANPLPIPSPYQIVVVILVGQFVAWMTSFLENWESEHPDDGPGMSKANNIVHIAPYFTAATAQAPHGWEVGA